jgi:hypothetical protein
MEPVTLVKYDYDSFPDDWKKSNPNPYEGVVFAYLGKIVNMPGHVYVQDIMTGKSEILHEENLLVLTEEET